MNIERAGAPAAGSSQVRSVLRVFAIFEHFAETRKPATLSMLARVLALPKSSCLALLKTLEAGGYLYEVAPRSGYYPTRKWLENARAISDADPIVSRLQPVLRELHESTGETVVLARQAENHVLYVDAIEPNANIRYSARIGQLRPLHATASGKALLANMPEPMRKHVLGSEPLVALTPQTITDRRALERELAEGQARGWHVTLGETESDVTGLAAIAHVAGEPYALVVAGPAYRLADRLGRLGATLRAACERASALPA